jgi:hypothetical protein
MRVDIDTTNKVCSLLTEHLGSTSVVVEDDGTLYSEMRYKAFGELSIRVELLPQRNTTQVILLKITLSCTTMGQGDTVKNLATSSGWIALHQSSMVRKIHNEDDF